MQLECKNLTGKNCSYTVEADTTEEAKRKMRDHIQGAHPEMTEEEITDMENKIEEEF